MACQKIPMVEKHPLIQEIVKNMKKIGSLILICVFLLSCEEKDLSNNLVKFQILENGNWIELNLNDSKEILKMAKMKRNSFYIWKGDKKGILTFKNGKKIEMKISYYGGFFYLPDLKTYYEIPKQHREKWEELINVKLKSL